jgi:decaprenylphospho-beta-D-erythro-pentofuranosid-2-ulose 2-reductase
MMDNSLGEPQVIVLLGGTSDIGLAIGRELLSPATRTVVLCCRDVAAGRQAAAELASATVTVDVRAFDARQPAGHAELMSSIAATHGDIDVVVHAAGLLGDDDVATADPLAAFELAEVNFAGALSALVAASNVLRAQGHGSIVVLSSVAGERVRAANTVYGATKAGLDGFAQGLGDRIAADGVHVLIVRPGFVHSSMTEGRPAAPLATTPEHVAAVAVRGLRQRRRIVWAPATLRPLFSVLRHLPAPVWRRLPLG